MLYRDILEALGTAAFAISGAFAARQKRLDIFGILVCTFATAVGGGTIRDVLIGNTPVAWMKDQQTISVIVVSYLLTLLFSAQLRRMQHTLAFFDAIGLGFATIIGVQRGLEADLSPSICVTLGMVTGCFGGVLRDVLLNEIPLVFHKDIYASASLLGGLLYFVCRALEINASVSAAIAIVSIVALRILVLRFGWKLPSGAMSDE
ncbi:MAG: trimeric intracellular cation channel family protein [Chitinophagales bacterium]|nr:trimeric intracellular cation channel family protein [Chitinophagales bacterium]